MIGRLIFAFTCMSMGIASSANAQAVQIESNVTDPKVVKVNRLLQAAQSLDGNLADIVAKGATVHKFGPDLLPLTPSSLRTAFEKCEPSIDGEHLSIEPKKLSVWMRCPTGADGTFISANMVEFGFKGGRISSIQFIVIVISAERNIELSNG